MNGILVHFIVMAKQIKETDCKQAIVLSKEYKYIPFID